MALVKVVIEEDGEIAIGTQDGTYAESSPKLKRLAAAIGVVLGPEFKAGEPEQHLHLHEDKASVQHRQHA